MNMSSFIRPFVNVETDVRIFTLVRPPLPEGSEALLTWGKPNEPFKSKEEQDEIKITTELDVDNTGTEQGANGFEEHKSQKDPEPQTFTFKEISRTSEWRTVDDGIEFEIIREMIFEGPKRIQGSTKLQPDKKAHKPKENLLPGAGYVINSEPEKEQKQLYRVTFSSPDAFCTISSYTVFEREVTT